MKKLSLIVLSLLLGILAFGQGTDGGDKVSVQSALGFLNIPSDSRSAGMGDLNVGTPVDPYSHQYNPSKYLFGDVKAGFSLSYSPWLRNLVKDMNLSGISGYYKLDSLQSVSASFRYFSMGSLRFTDGNNTQFIGDKTAYQLSFDAAYARKLSQYFGASVTFRYALSDFYPSHEGYKKGWGVAADLNGYFQKDLTLGSMATMVTAGAGITNIGTKVSFKDGAGNSYFMPMMFKLGGSLAGQLDGDNRLMVGLELGRSLVPSSADKRDESSLSGMFSSIGEGDFRSLGWSFGAEYGYKQMLFARAGYHTESDAYTSRDYLTFGLGLKYNIAHLDAAYMIATGNKNDAMANTLRFSVAIDLFK